jgi:SAM-dependent methyltransferase
VETSPVEVELSKQKQLQENQYYYPYHYLPFRDHNGFSQTQYLGWGYEYLSYIDYIIEKLAEKRFNSLLDVGCGDGRFLFELSRKSSCQNLTGIDYSKKAITFAKAFNPTINFICADLTNENIPIDRKYDIVTCIETLEHIHPDDLNRFIQNLHFCTIKGGLLLLTVPSLNRPLHDKHYQHFTIENLTELLEPYFIKTSHSFINRNNFFVRSILQRFFANRYFIINEKKILNTLYNFYIKHFLVANQNDCYRIFTIFKKS